MDDTGQEFHIKEIEDAIDRFEVEKAALPTLQKIDAPNYIYMNLEELRKKSPEELSEASFLIAQYSFYIQRLINKNNALIRWGASKLDELAVQHLDECGGNSFERTLTARNRPEICRKLNAFMRRIKLEHDRLSEVPTHLKHISDCIRDIKFSLTRKN